MKTAPGVPSGSEKSRPRPAPAARDGRRVLRELRPHAGDADAADDLAAAIDRNAAGIDRHGAELILPGVEDVGLAGGDADR